MENQQLTKHPENRENFELDFDPKLYVKDKYRYYNNGRVRTVLWIAVAVLVGALFLLLTVHFVGGHHKSDSAMRATKRSWPTDTAVDTTNVTTVDSVTSVHTPTHTSPTQHSEPTSNTPTSVTINDTETAAELERRRLFVTRMAYFAWDQYERHAWGQETLRPLTKKYSWRHFGLNSGLTIVTAMSTLWVMGMEEEFAAGRTWIKQHLNLTRVTQHINVQHTVTQYMGSLLSCYALTGDQFFLQKAQEIAVVLKPAYNTTSGLSYPSLLPKTGSPMITIPSLSAVGGQHVDYVYLSDMTNDQHYRTLMTTTRQYLQRLAQPSGLYLKNVYVETGEWFTNVSTLAKAGGDFYSYLIKSYIQSNGHDLRALHMYREAIDAVDHSGMFGLSSPSAMVFARNYHTNDGKHSNHMSSDSCYLGAMLALGARAMQHLRDTKGKDAVTDEQSEGQRIERHWSLARQLTDTCHQAAVRTNTGLPPHDFYFNHRNEATNVDQSNREFHLSFESAESYFTLWRLTGDTKYREYAWHLAQAIERHCRTDNGYSSIRDTNQVPTLKINYQDSQLLGATLKYLFLTFADAEHNLPLEKWVFNAFGQPLPICGSHNHHYRCDHY